MKKEHISSVFGFVFLVLALAGIIFPSTMPFIPYIALICLIAYMAIALFL